MGQVFCVPKRRRDDALRYFGTPVSALIVYEQREVQKSTNYVPGVPLLIQDIAFYWDSQSDCSGDGGVAAVSPDSIWVARAERIIDNFAKKHGLLSSVNCVEKIPSNKAPKDKPKRRHSGRLFEKPFVTLSGKAKVCAPHFVALITLFLRKLPEPLIPSPVVRNMEVVLCNQTVSEEAKALEIGKVFRQSFISMYPQEYALFQYLRQLLQRHRAELIAAEVEALMQIAVREADEKVLGFFVEQLRPVVGGGLSPNARRAAGDCGSPVSSQADVVVEDPSVLLHCSDGSFKQCSGPLYPVAAAGYDGVVAEQGGGLLAMPTAQLPPLPSRRGSEQRAPTDGKECVSSGDMTEDCLTLYSSRASEDASDLENDLTSHCMVPCTSQGGAGESASSLSDRSGGCAVRLDLDTHNDSSCSMRDAGEKSEGVEPADEAELYSPVGDDVPPHAADTRDSSRYLTGAIRGRAKKGLACLGVREETLAGADATRYPATEEGRLTRRRTKNLECSIRGRPLADDDDTEGTKTVTSLSPPGMRLAPSRPPDAVKGRRHRKYLRDTTVKHTHQAALLRAKQLFLLGGDEAPSHPLPFNHLALQVQGNEVANVNGSGVCEASSSIMAGKYPSEAQNEGPNRPFLACAVCQQRTLVGSVSAGAEDAVRCSREAGCLLEQHPHLTSIQPLLDQVEQLRAQCSILWEWHEQFNKEHEMLQRVTDDTKLVKDAVQHLTQSHVETVADLLRIEKEIRGRADVPDPTRADGMGCCEEGFHARQLALEAQKRCSKLEALHQEEQQKVRCLTAKVRELTIRVERDGEENIGLKIRLSAAQQQSAALREKLITLHQGDGAPWTT
uniref:WGS project CAEQ00000000 data, annotated contig 2357 n=1 Tax=Trypanosoma congolense (strain IL3000) TaxID=1068625 RepID=F9WDD8_TRYCI|nr:unnamed protein product [Trypanosoma congolense IL3000]